MEQQLQENVDLTFMFRYLKDYDANAKTAIYILPEEFELNFEKIKSYFGESTSLNWNRPKFGNQSMYCYLSLDLKDGINYKIFPDIATESQLLDVIENHCWKC